jgi:methylglutaconyl-CoA hydratase
VISPFVLARTGPGVARELFLTGERFSAERAREIGLVQHLVHEEGLDAKVAERVEALLRAAPGAQAAVKALLPRVAYQVPPAVRELTAREIAARRASAEGQEGLRAFLEKRRPAWRD